LSATAVALNTRMQRKSEPSFYTRSSAWKSSITADYLCVGPHLQSVRRERQKQWRPPQPKALPLIRPPPSR
jgi:hypothetical protein